MERLLVRRGGCHVVDALWWFSVVEMTLVGVNRKLDVTTELR